LLHEPTCIFSHHRLAEFAFDGAVPFAEREFLRAKQEFVNREF
jgi:hypothetical protein